MLSKEFDIILDIKKNKPLNTNIELVSGDSLSNKIMFQMYDNNSKKFNLTEVNMVTMTILRPDGEVFVDGAVIEDALNGLVSFAFKGTEIGVEGRYTATLEFYGTAGERITSSIFLFDVRMEIAKENAEHGAVQYPVLAFIEQEVFNHIKDDIRHITKALTDTIDTLILHSQNGEIHLNEVQIGIIEEAKTHIENGSIHVDQTMVETINGLVEHRNDGTIHVNQEMLTELADLVAHANNTEIHLSEEQNNLLIALNEHLENGNMHLTPEQIQLIDEIGSHILNGAIHLTTSQVSLIEQIGNHISNNAIHLSQTQLTLFSQLSEHLNNAGIHLSAMQVQKIGEIDNKVDRTEFETVIGSLPSGGGAVDPSQIQHNSLQGLQGGQTGEYMHVTQAEKSSWNSKLNAPISHTMLTDTDVVGVHSVNAIAGGTFPEIVKGQPNNQYALAQLRNVIITTVVPTSATGYDDGTIIIGIEP